VSLENVRVVVIGALGGIGSALARRIRTSGGTPILMDRSEQRLAMLGSELGAQDGGIVRGTIWRGPLLKAVHDQRHSLVERQPTFPLTASALVRLGSLWVDDFNGTTLTMRCSWCRGPDVRPNVSPFRKLWPERTWYFCSRELETSWW
jgi:hypothetical protein